MTPAELIASKWPSMVASGMVKVVETPIVEAVAPKPKRRRGRRPSTPYGFRRDYLRNWHRAWRETHRDYSRAYKKAWAWAKRHSLPFYWCPKRMINAALLGESKRPKIERRPKRVAYQPDALDHWVRERRAA